MSELLTSREFKAIGHQVIDRLALFLDTIGNIPVTRAENPDQVQLILGTGNLPLEGSPPESLLENTISPDVGAWQLSPMASEIERQTIKWIAEFIGYDSKCGGIFVSGGNMANFVGPLTARKSKGTENIQEAGLRMVRKQMVVYASEETHTRIQKAMDLFGFGTHAIRWITTNERREMDVQALEEAIIRDEKDGFHPFLVIATAGLVSLGIVDPLDSISEICKRHDLWLHVDRAYGAPASGLSKASGQLQALRLADSVAVDPHKWLYSALEVGCALVKDARTLVETFSHHPD